MKRLNNVLQNFNTKTSPQLSKKTEKIKSLTAAPMHSLYTALSKCTLALLKNELMKSYIKIKNNIFSFRRFKLPRNLMSSYIKINWEKRNLYMYLKNDLWIQGIVQHM